MGRKRNNPQSIGKGESSETMLNEIGASQISDIEFKTMLIRKLNELSANYQKLQEIMRNLLQTISALKRGIEPKNKGQEDMKTRIYELRTH